MSWRDLVHPASYNGVPFSYRADEYSAGKTIATHIFPYRAQPWHEFTGWQPQRINFTALVHGEQYERTLAELLAELNKPGSGILDHPIYGEIEVIATTHTVRQRTSVLGQAEVSISYVEPGKQPAHTADNTRQLLYSSADALAQTATEQAGKQLVTRGLDTGAITQLGESLRAYAVRGRQIVQRVNNSVRPVAELQQAADDLRSSITQLVNTPSQIASTVASTADSLLALLDTPATALAGIRALLDTVSFAYDRSQVNPRSVNAMATNVASLTQLTENIHLASAGKLLANAVDYAVAGKTLITEAQAQTVANAIASRAEQIQQTESETYNDAIVAKLAEMRTHVLGYVAPARLRTESAISTERAMPLVVLQYRATGHPLRGEAARLNAISTPQSVPAGEYTYAEVA